jgi:8-oxo-dGTP diphosphatase
MATLLNRIYQEFPRIGVGVLIKKGNQYLLVKRGQEPAKGIWTVPGGMVEMGEKLEQAAHREVFEECNIKIKDCCQIDIFEFIERDDKQKIKYHYIVVEFLANYSSGTIGAKSDVDDAAWFSLKDLGNLDTTKETIDLVKKCFSQQ